MLFAIRDDDTAYFTKPEELKQAYDFVKSGPISLSVVPNAVPVHRDDVFPYGKDIAYQYYSIEGNTDLVKYLKCECKNGRYDILLHGYSHEYQKIDGRWTAEMMWKSEKQILEEMKAGKELLEELLSVPVKVFVAPNNSIDQKAISAVEQLGMNYSGIIQINDRALTLRYVQNFIRRWTVRVAQEIPYPGVLDYGKHRELVAYTLDNIERLKKEYLICKKKSAPFVVYTHYWQVNSDPQIKTMLKEIYDYAINDGAQLVCLSDCFKV